MSTSTESSAPNTLERDLAIKVLLSEKDYADQQITGNFTSNARFVGTIFTIVVTVLGWVFATNPPLHPYQVSLVLLSLVALGSISLIMGALSNGFAFGFISYKSGFLGPRLAQITGLNYNPLWATAFINTTPARKLIVFATTFLAVGQLALSLGVFIAGSLMLWREFSKGAVPLSLLWFIPVAALMLVGASTGAVYTVSTVASLHRTYSGAQGNIG